MNPRSLTFIAVCLVVIAIGILLFNQKRAAETLPDMRAEENAIRPFHRDSGSASDKRSRDGRTPDRSVEMLTMQELAVIERDRMTGLWLQNAAAVFEKMSGHLATDLKLSAEQTGEVEKIFARRQQELARLLASMTSGEAADGNETFRKITALIRNKGLRGDLEGLLSEEQLAALDAAEAKRERETVEARAYLDMAGINAVVQLTDSQKQQVLGVLAERAAEKVEQEADARAFMSLAYGGLAADMDAPHVRGLSNLLNMSPAQDPNLEFGSAEYQQWIEEQKSERIENELSALRGVLNDDQLARYREHLEAEPPR